MLSLWILKQPVAKDEPGLQLAPKFVWTQQGPLSRGMGSAPSFTLWNCLLLRNIMAHHRVHKIPGIQHSQSLSVSLNICVRVFVQFGLHPPSGSTRLLCNPNSITMFTRARILPWSRFCRFTPSHPICYNICFNNNFPLALVYFMRCLFFDKNLLCICDVMCAACPTPSSASYLLAVCVFAQAAITREYQGPDKISLESKAQWHWWYDFSEGSGSLSAPEGSVCVILRIIFDCVRKIAKINC
jgi:hypothetical protein